MNRLPPLKDGVRQFRFGDDLQGWFERQLFLFHELGRRGGYERIQSLGAETRDKATPLARKVMANEAARMSDAMKMPRSSDGKRFAPKKVYGNEAWRSLEVSK